MKWIVNHDQKNLCRSLREIIMVDLLSYLVISLVTFCFGLLVSFQITHIYYVRRLTKLAKRSVDTGTIAPVLVALEETRKR
jgi:hypothetical protein